MSHAQLSLKDTGQRLSAVIRKSQNFFLCALERVKCFFYFLFLLLLFSFAEFKPVCQRYNEAKVVRCLMFCFWYLTHSVEICNLGYRVYFIILRLLKNEFNIVSF